MRASIFEVYGNTLLYISVKDNELPKVDSILESSFTALCFAQRDLKNGLRYKVLYGSENLTISLCCMAVAEGGGEIIDRVNHTLGLIEPDLIYIDKFITGKIKRIYNRVELSSEDKERIYWRRCKEWKIHPDLRA